MVGDGRCCKLFVFRVLAFLLSTHADRHAVDISFTVCVSAGFFVRDISGVGWLRAMKFCRVVDLGVRQVISPFGELWLRVSPQGPKSEKLW